MKWTIVIALVLLTFIQVKAQIITDRPDQTEASATIPKGSFQIETGFQVLHRESPTTQVRDISFPSTLFKYGLTSGIELRVFNQYDRRRLIDFGNEFNSSGMSDLEIGFKAQLLRKETVNAEIAFLSHLLVPSGSLGFSDDSWGTINKISISHSLHENIGLGYNIGYDYFGEGSGTLTYSIALGFSLTDKLGVYAEYFGSIEEFDFHVTNADGGLTYLLNNNLQLDFSFGAGINNKMNYLGLGVSWNIPGR